MYVRILIAQQTKSVLKAYRGEYFLLVCLLHQTLRNVNTKRLDCFVKVQEGFFVDRCFGVVEVERSSESLFFPFLLPTSEHWVIRDYGILSIYIHFFARRERCTEFRPKRLRTTRPHFFSHSSVFER